MQITLLSIFSFSTQDLASTVSCLWAAVQFSCLASLFFLKESVDMDNKETINVLNDLIETCKDGENGFNQCAEGLQDPELKTSFQQRAEKCAEAARELQQLVRDFGGEPETRSSTSGTLHRRWLDVKTLITGKDNLTVLNECERGEDVAKDSYRSALEKDLPEFIRAVVEKQYRGVLQNHDYVKQLRNSAKAASNASS